VKNILIIIVISFLFACNSASKSVDQLWKEGQEYRIENNYKDAITNFKIIISNYPENKLSSKAQFQIADIYLNDIKNYEYAIKEFKTVVELYSNDSDAKKSLFMIAYIYNNYMNAYTDAITYYNLFKNKYPNDELIPSVEYELNGLIHIESQIDSLNSISNEKSNI
jgi:outer membrane protein assembly factor BamD (BamD/ComL family)|tara:strand:+ start:44 stop:541 length:498 start_codon:yes stop_codon:yes gene_type:complete